MKLPVFQRILFPTDMSESAGFAFPYAAELAHRLNGHITILHVIENPSHAIEQQILSYLGESGWKDLQKHREDDFVAAAKNRLSAFCQDMSDRLDDCPFIVEEIKVLHGLPSEIILHEAEKGGFDLVVMGTHGFGLLANALMGSVATRVVRHCSKPVLTIRLPKEKRE